MFIYTYITHYRCTGISLLSSRCHLHAGHRALHVVAHGPGHVERQTEHLRPGILTTLGRPGGCGFVLKPLVIYGNLTRMMISLYETW